MLPYIRSSVIHNKQIMRYSVLILTLVLLSGSSYQMGRGYKYVMMIFEGSDWCPNCNRLEKNILNDSGFLNYLKSNRIELIKVDFPQRKKLDKQQTSDNEQLAKRYKFEGIFPTIVLSRTDTLVFEKFYYQNQTIGEFTALIQNKLHMLK